MRTAHQVGEEGKNVTTEIKLNGKTTIESTTK